MLIVCALGLWRGKVEGVSTQVLPLFFFFFFFFHIAFTLSFLVRCILVSRINHALLPQVELAAGQKRRPRACRCRSRRFHVRFDALESSEISFVTKSSHAAMCVPRAGLGRAFHRFLCIDNLHKNDLRKPAQAFDHRNSAANGTNPRPIFFDLTFFFLALVGQRRQLFFFFLTTSSSSP